MFVMLLYFVIVLVGCGCESSLPTGGQEYHSALDHTPHSATTPPSRVYWSYENQSAWPGALCHEGARQSPIAVREAEAELDWDLDFIKRPLKLIGYQYVLMTGVNNGFTVQLSTDGEAAMHPIITGGPLQHWYRLEQVHFHWLSEHSIDDRKYPMEIHFVHVRADLTVSEALRQKSGLAIVAVMCHVKSWLTEMDSDPLNKVVELLPSLRTRGARRSGIVLDLGPLIQPGSKSFYAYSGSLTSPECNEVVTWIIYDTPLPMSAYQHSRFVETSPLKNSRDIQPIKSIKVYKIKPDTIFEKPAIVTAFDNFYQTFKGFFSDMKSSFVVQVPTHHLETFMKEDFWPQGVVFRKFRGRLPAESRYTSLTPRVT